MPITQDRFLSLLTAAEDALRALREARKIVDTEVNKVRKLSLSPQEALSNLDLLFKEEFLLAQPVETLLVIKQERERFSPTRLGINRRSRERMRRLRHNSQGEQG